MRLRILLILGLLASSALYTAAQDFNATATQQIIAATQTEAARRGEPQAAETEDPFVLTATQLVRDVTRTAISSTGRTAIPVTRTPTPDVRASATALIADATRTAQPASTQTGDDADEEPAETLSIAALIVGGLIVVLTAIGGVFGLTGGANKSDQTS